MTEHVQPYMPGFEAEQRRRDLSQFFTPPWLAEDLWRWMRRGHARAPVRLLEPAAGRGALLDPIRTTGIAVRHVIAYEADPVNVAHLAAALRGLGLPAEVRGRDFMADPDIEHFDLCVMNPPFEDGQDVAFAARACAVSTWVGGIFPARIEHSEGRSEFWRWHDMRRKVVLTKRPHFGGDYSPMTDFVLLDLQRRKTARKQGEPSTVNTEWW